MRKVTNEQASCCQKYCKCLLRRIGATIMGVKPTEMRRIKLDASRWHHCKQTLLAYDQLEIVELGRKQGRQKVLFYHQSALEEQLRQSNVLKFLQEIGYPQDYNLVGYINYLKQRLQQQDFPHEIGIFFGYPLKDVLGFMGYLDLEVTYRGEWKFYGNKTISLLRQKKFAVARESFRAKIDNLEEVEEFHKVV